MRPDNMKPRQTQLLASECLRAHALQMLAGRTTEGREKATQNEENATRKGYMILRYKAVCQATFRLVATSIIHELQQHAWTSVWEPIKKWMRQMTDGRNSEAARRNPLSGERRPKEEAKRISTASAQFILFVRTSL
eukprot:gnl/TRDRNA2_/TRDRNA2_32001_c0_seq1.p1 gnl/TRDRNA2_/TRDRNA2_32001_c0~~gnl/TRDRNA2_/TRDRNA2_32001_c0_seq1.p1  ORF type:complete len:136 (+),score=6.65 gnl/TRDRNA2_/TRDRNA2_32001_c0_seq1:38-445(+)